MSSNEQAKARKEKTREIKVWVDAVALEQFLKHSYGYCVTIRNKPFGQSDCEVTLLIKEQETEEQKAIRLILNSPFAVGLTEECRNELKEKLFGSEI